MPEGAAPKAGASMPMAVAKAEAGPPVVGRLRPADTALRPTGIGDVAPPPPMHIPIRVIVDAKARSKASPKQANPMPEGAAPKAGASMPMAVAKAEAGPPVVGRLRPADTALRPTGVGDVAPPPAPVADPPGVGDVAPPPEPVAGPLVVGDVAPPAAPVVVPARAKMPPHPVVVTAAAKMPPHPLAAPVPAMMHPPLPLHIPMFAIVDAKANGAPPDAKAGQLAVIIMHPPALQNHLVVLPVNLELLQNAGIKAPIMTRPTAFQVAGLVAQSANWSEETRLEHLIRPASPQKHRLSSLAGRSVQKTLSPDPRCRPLTARSCSA